MWFSLHCTLHDWCRWDEQRHWRARFRHQVTNIQHVIPCSSGESAIRLAITRNCHLWPEMARTKFMACTGNGLCIRFQSGLLNEIESELRCQDYPLICVQWSFTNSVWSFVLLRGWDLAWLWRFVPCTFMNNGTISTQCNKVHFQKTARWQVMESKQMMYAEGFVSSFWQTYLAVKFT